MAYTTGTADDYIDLLDEFKTFLTTNGWTAKRDTIITAAPEQTRELIFYHAGSGGANDIYFGIRSYLHIPTPYGSNILSRAIYPYLRAQGYTSYNPLGTFDDMSGAINSVSKCPTIPMMFARKMKYYFLADGYRAIIAVKCGRFWHGMYLGYHLPFASPEVYINPLVISGTSYAGNTTQYPYNYWDGAAFWYPSLGDHTSNGSSNMQVLIGQEAGWRSMAKRVKPFFSIDTYGDDENWATSNDSGTSETTFCLGQNLLDGSIGMEPIILFSTDSGNKHVWGSLDGVFAVHNGENTIQPEDIINDGTYDYVVLPCAGLSKNNQVSFAALRLN